MARPRGHGFRGLRDDPPAGLTVDLPSPAPFRRRPAIVSVPGLSLVRNQEQKYNTALDSAVKKIGLGRTQLSSEPRQYESFLLLGYAPVSVLHLTNVFVDIKTIVAK